MRAAMPRGGQPERRPTYFQTPSQYLVLQAWVKCNTPLESENSHFFKWLFTKMAVSMVSDPESEQELAESHLMLMNDCLCFRISSSFVGNNPSLQIHSFSKDLGKCNKTCNPSISDFSTILTSHLLSLADSSHLPCDEAYRQCLSLPCNRLSTPCYECKPKARHFFDKIFIKARFWWG